MVDCDRKFKLGILGSGKGSNMAAIAAAAAEPSSPFQVALVLSDNADAKILTLARQRGLQARPISSGPLRARLPESAEKEFIAALREAEVELVVLAGFMRILKAEFIQAFPRRIVNIHPSLLPAFPGLEAWKQAIEHGVKVTGCTVHFVDQGVDTGPILAQQTVPVMADDTPETLHERIQEAERVLYPATIAALARGKVRVEGRQARII